LSIKQALLFLKKKAAARESKKTFVNLGLWDFKRPAPEYRDGWIGRHRSVRKSGCYLRHGR
jgi:hypothetical protein